MCVNRIKGKVPKVIVLACFLCNNLLASGKQIEALGILSSDRRFFQQYKLESLPSCFIAAPFLGYISMPAKETSSER